MAFSMNGMSSGFGAGASGPTMNDGEELPEIQAEGLGFKTLHGDKKARLLKDGWPADALPPPFASLLSIASARGLYAAGGPDVVVVGKTQDARDRIYDTQGEDVRICAPLHSLPHSRPVHLAFAADESCLVVAEQNAPEIVAYRTEDLAAKKSNVALKLSTNAPLRMLAPNPDPAQSQYFALVNTNGQLLLADLGSNQLTSGANGPVLAENVSCVEWSTKGKQLIAGKGDGTAVQLKPDGTVVANIPKPDSVPANCFLARIAWLENDVFFFVYTPTSPSDPQEAVSEYYLVKTNKGRTEFTLRKPVELLYPSVDRLPAHFFMSRLRNYKPHLDELLIVSGTVSSEVKLITKASRPLSDEAGENEPYTNTVPQDEQRWAALPMGLDGSSDTTPIGMAIDLSDKDPVLKPIPADSEIETSTIPVPELVALNNEGILSIWAVVYDDAVRSQQVYPGFEEVSRLRQNLPRVSTGNTVAAPTPVAAPQTAEPTGSPFATPTPATSALQPPSNTATTSDSKQQSQAFGAGSSFGNGSGFSKPTPIGGETKPSWASSGFGGDNIKAQSGGFGQAPAFGSTPTLGSKPAFGQSGGIGQQTSGAPAFGQTGFGSKPAFGQTGFGAQSGQSSPFASKPPAASSPFAGAGANTQSGFGSFAGQGGGFASSNKDNKAENSFGSAFGKGGGFGEAKASSPFSSAGKTAQSPFGQPSGPSVFGKPSPLSGAAPATSSPFGQAATKGFQLESTFQKDETSKDEDDDKQDTSSGFGFGGLGNMLGGNKAKEAQQSPSKEEEMKDDEESVTEVESTKKPQETPPATINQPKTSTTPHVSSLFGNNQQESTTPQTQPKSSLTTGWGFGNHPSTTPKDTPAPSRSIFGTQPISQDTPAAVQKSEPNKPFSSTPKDTPAPTNSIFGTQPVSKDTPAAVQKSEPNKPFSFKPMPSEISDSDRIKSLSDSDEEEDQSDEENDEPTKTPEAPLPPNPFSKPDYQAGDTSASSINSKTSREPEDAPLPPGFAPANKNASRSLKTQESEPPSEGLSDEFAGSGEDVTGDVSPVEERDSGPSDAGEQTEHVETSPESSFGNATDRSAVASPTGGLFTKVSKIEQAKPPPRLFGEMGTSVPSFAPPKPQESPRSPSPMRKPPRHATLSRSPERSFSAPAHSRSIMQQRKLEHQQSPFATQAAQARDEEMARERARIDAARQAQEAAEAMETQPLIDEEDEILQAELAKPTEPSENLDPFLPSQDVSQSQEVDQGRTDVPSQIEKLYQDINSMVMTLGINAKSLSAYMMYQSGQEPDDNWPDVLTSDTPMDAMNEEWFFGDIDRIPAGTDALDRVLDGLEMKDVMQKLEDCQNLLTKEVTDLRGRITALRRSTQARAQPENNTHAPLSAEQASIQQDLRRASAVVLTNLAQVEDNLVVLRAKLADIAPSKISSEKQSMLGMMSSAQKKPSVEAVMSTVTKMTSMAEKRSADVDVLEAQLRKLNMSTSMNGTQEPSTPERRISRRNPATPGSGASSIFYTPDSKGSRSGRATPKNQQPVVPVEDSEKWQAKARRRKEVANVLKDVLREKHGKAKA